jgi:hypothetical protein
VVPEDQLTKWGGHDAWRLTSEEVVCTGDSCTGVTNGIYLTEADLADSEIFDYYLPKAIGLEPAW